MARYLVASLTVGVLFGLMDGIINGNAYAQQLLKVYRPIARNSVNISAGLFIDLFYGFALAALFLLLRSSLPGSAGLIKGLSFGVLVWFLRVFMGTAAEWMIVPLPAAALLYRLLTGLIQMGVIGITYGLILGPGR